MPGMRTDESASSARQAILRLFFTQCMSGAQTKDLSPELAACGQFIGPNALTRTQRGAHGTAAALGVLSDGASNEHVELTRRLVRYMESQWLSNGVGFSLHDGENVIKLSESLHALLGVPRATAATEALTEELANRLSSSRLEDRGWTYFTGANSKQVQELPTAFAVRALARRGSTDLAASASYLLGCVRKAYSKTSPEPNSDIYVHIFSLYVLVTSEIRGFNFAPSEAQQLFDSFWERLKSLQENLEQNLEYWYDDRQSFYVRVPWQLYLLALAARLAPLRVLTSAPAEARLNSLFSAIQSEQGFRYPHSGDIPSSRTNAIFYEVLGHVQHASSGRWFALFRSGRSFTNVVASRPVRYMFVLAATFVIAMSVIDWWNAPNRSWRELGSDIIAGVLMTIVMRRHD